jgi:hypothetical protein
MPPAVELVSGRAVAPSTTFTGLTVNTGNSLTVRNADISQPIAILQCWVDVQAAGTVRIRSPRLHDNVQGIRLDTVAGDVVPLFPWGVGQPLIPQDTLIVELTGSATAGDVEAFSMLIFYADLPGISARLHTWDEIAPRIRNVVTVENTLATDTSGNYSGEEAIDVEFDLLKANTDYALLGYFVDTECCSVRWRGSDVGNLGIGGPGEPGLRFVTKEWFVLLSQTFGLPLIPVFNAANKSGILIDAFQDENGADPTVTQIFAELG